MEVKGTKTVWSTTFFRISSFMYHIQVGLDMWVSNERSQNFNFWGTIPQHFEHFLTQSYCMASKYILCVCVVCVLPRNQSHTTLMKKLTRNTEGDDTVTSATSQLLEDASERDQRAGPSSPFRRTCTESESPEPADSQYLQTGKTSYWTFYNWLLRLRQSLTTNLYHNGQIQDYLLTRTARRTL